MHEYLVIFVEDDIFKLHKLGESSFISLPRGKSEKYLYVLQLNGAACTKNPYTKNLLSKHGKDFYCNISSDILNDIKANKCKMVFDYSAETNDALSLSLILTDLIDNTIEHYSLSKRDVMLCTGNVKSIKEHNKFYIAVSNFYLNLIEPDHKLLDSQRNLILNKTVRNKKCLCLMRKPRPHRYSIAEIFYKRNLLKNNIVTMGSPESYSRLFGFNQTAMNEIKKHYSADFVNSLPWVADYEHVTVANGLLNTEAERTLYLETTVNFIVESYVDVDGIELDITEKITKPIVSLQPFVLYGQPGALKELKNMGYKTFDRWWDESYDTISSSKVRMHYIVELFAQISAMSSDELAEMHYNMLPTLEHNLNVYIEQQKHYLDDIHSTLNLMFDDK